MTSNFTIRTSRTIEQAPLQDLFSPTELEQDLSYVDKTYYGFINTITEEVTDEKKSIEKYANSDLQSLMIGKAMRMVKSISRLDLHSAGLLTLPNQISLLTKLTILDLSCNQLQTLPNCFDHLIHLKQLNLSKNKLSLLPVSLYSLTRLIHLDLSRNPFQKVSPNLGRLQSLGFLDLSHTKISYLPAELLSLSMTTLKLDDCPDLNQHSIDIQHRLTHNPMSLLETCARQIIQPILLNIILRTQSKKPKLKKKQLAREEEERHQKFSRLPDHLIDYLSQPKACSSCGGPYFESFVKRYRIVQRQDELWIPIEYKLCSAHWNTEQERLLDLFTESAPYALPTINEPCQLTLVKDDF